MKSKMSFFDPTLLKKNVSRFAPAWGLLLLFLFLTRSLTLLNRLQGLHYGDGASNVRTYLLNGEVFNALAAFFAAGLLAALVFKYLHKARSAYMTHAFPMTRTCLFVTNVLSGLLFYLVPVLAVGLVDQLILSVNGLGSLSGLLWGRLGRWLLQYLFFYGLAVFCMVLSGRTVIAVLSYGALNFIFLLIPVLVLILVRCYCYGLDLEVGDWLLRLSPLVGMIFEGGDTPIGLLLLYAAVGLILLVLGWLLYQKRHVERAGDAMAYGWAKVAFRLVFTLCCTLGLGWILASFFDLFSGRGGAFLPWALVGCFLGWFSSSMMLQRTVRVFKNKKNWLGFGIFAAVLIAAVLGLRYDVLGWQRRLPDPEEIESVEIWSADGSDWRPSDRITVTDARDIGAVWEIHSKELTERSGGYDLYSGRVLGSSYNTLHIVYRLKGGGTLRRAYQIDTYSQRAALSELYTKPEYAVSWYEKTLPGKIRMAVLYDYPMEQEVDEYGNITVLDPSSGGERTVTDGEALRAAMLADAAAGRLPIWSQFTNYDCICYSMSVYKSSSDPYLAVSLEIPATAEETLKLFNP